MNLIQIRNFTYGLLRQDNPEANAVSYPEDWVNQCINIGYREAQELSGNLEGYSSLALTAGTRYVAVPSDFEAVKQLNYVYDGASNSYPMRPLPYQEFDWTWSGQGRPTHYHIRQSRIYMVPIPSSSDDTLDLYYYTIPSELSANTDSPSLPASFHHYLGFYAAYCCKLRDRDPQRADNYKREWEAGKKELRTRTLYLRTEQEFGMVRDDYMEDMW